MLVVEIKFSANSRSYYYNAQNFSDLVKNDAVIVDYNECKEYGIVESKPQESDKPCLIKNVGKIIRKATKEDTETHNKLLDKEKEATKVIQENIEKFNLEMKLVEVKYSFDSTKLYVRYTADNRVDFRELVKTLASVFKTRVELRQISSREESKILGGFGPCGKEFCCAKFLNDEQQVAIKMAKSQNLALNPNKINGVCGKLMCCIEYEYPQYQEILAKMPPVGSIVNTPSGKGKVVYQDILGEKLSVEIIKDDTTKIEVFSLEDVKQ